MSGNTGGGSTKQLKHVLGFGDLMGAAVGQIIGAGIMTLLGSAIAMTGRSVRSGCAAETIRWSECWPEKPVRVRIH